MFQHYEIRKVAQFPNPDGNIYYQAVSETPVADLEDSMAILWALYGFTEKDLTEHIADRETFTGIADLYYKLTGCRVEREEDHFRMPTRAVPEWEELKRMANEPGVTDALRDFYEDPAEDNAARVVQAAVKAMVAGSGEG